MSYFIFCFAFYDIFFISSEIVLPFAPISTTVLPVAWSNVTAPSFESIVDFAALRRVPERVSSVPSAFIVLTLMFDGIIEFGKELQDPQGLNQDFL